MPGRNQRTPYTLPTWVPLGAMAVSAPLLLTACATEDDDPQANSDLCDDFVNTEVDDDADAVMVTSISIGDTGVSWASVDSDIVDDDVFDRVQFTYGMIVVNDSGLIAENIDVAIDLEVDGDYLSDSFIDDASAAQHLEFTIPYILPGEEYPVGGEVLAPAGVDEPASAELVVDVNDDVTWQPPGESDYYQAVEVTEANFDPRSGEVHTGDDEALSDSPGWDFTAHVCYEDSFLGRVSGVFRDSQDAIIGGVHEHTFTDQPDGSNSSLNPGETEYSAVLLDPAPWESIYQDVDDLHVDLALYRHG